MDRPDLYISADVETDGPIPGPYSMLSFGLSLVGTFDGTTFDRAAEGRSFKALLQPISEHFQDEALAVNGLDRERLAREGRSPDEAMNTAYDWVMAQAGAARAILVAYPVSFDWSWLYWYFERFAEQGSPFGHSACLDIRSYFMAAAGAPFSAGSKANLPSFIKPNAPHTHDALDDAIEQGELFANLLAWRLETGRLARRNAAPSAPDWLARRMHTIT